MVPIPPSPAPLPPPCARWKVKRSSQVNRHRHLLQVSNNSDFWFAFLVGGRSERPAARGGKGGVTGRAGGFGWGQRSGGRYLLVDGLEELPLVLPDFGVVHLAHQFGVLVDEPRLPENVRSCVFHLRGTTWRRKVHTHTHRHTTV